MISRWKRNLAPYLELSDVGKPKTNRVYHSVLRDISSSTSLPHHCPMYMYQVWCTHSMLGLLHRVYLSCRQCWSILRVLGTGHFCPLDASSFRTWMSSKKVEVVLALQVVETGGLPGPVLDVGNICTLHLLGIPSQNFGGSNQHLTPKKCRHFENNKKNFPSHFLTQGEKKKNKTLFRAKSLLKIKIRIFSPSSSTEIGLSIT